jgi:hypothetical protein
MTFKRKWDLEYQTEKGKGRCLSRSETVTDLIEDKIKMRLTHLTTLLY